MERGEGLAEAIRAEGAHFPTTYRAAVEAGLRSGRLSAALEDLAAFARGYAELRRSVGLALLYPMMVLMLAYGLFVAFVVRLLPGLIAAFESFRIAVPVGARQMEGLGHSAVYWGPIVPALGLGVLGWWTWTGRAGALRVGRGLRWVPWMRSVLADWQASNFAGWMALLVEHGVPLPEAVELASEAAGDPKILAAGRRIAEATRRGEGGEAALRDAGAGFPPLLRWLVLTGERQGDIGPALRHASETYRRRALRRAEELRTTLPTILLLLIGGTAGVLYTLALFLPWTHLLGSLSRPTT